MLSLFSDFFYLLHQLVISHNSIVVDLKFLGVEYTHLETAVQQSLNIVNFFRLSDLDL